jgi:hypothetical protein
MADATLPTRRVCTKCDKRKHNVAVTISSMLHTNGLAPDLFEPQRPSFGHVHDRLASTSAFPSTSPTKRRR